MLGFIQTTTEQEIAFDSRQRADASAERTVKQMETKTLTDYLPELTHGNRLAVYVAVRIAGGLGTSVNDLLDLICISRPTVANAMRYLVREELVFEEIENGRTRYWLKRDLFAPKGEPAYLSRESSHKDSKNTDSRLHVVKNFFTTSHDDDDLVQDSEIEHHHHDPRASEKIFAETGFQGKNLTELGARVDADTARAWADWVNVANRSEYRNPHGYAWACLKADPRANPPATKRKRSFVDGYEQFVHGTPEHARYCRENPGAFDCDCGEVDE